jgi:hypothetical protein
MAVRQKGFDKKHQASSEIPSSSMADIATCLSKIAVRCI